MDAILRENPAITVRVLQDLRAGLSVPGEGRAGMTADPVLRAAVLTCKSYDLI